MRTTNTISILPVSSIAVRFPVLAILTFGYTIAIFGQKTRILPARQNQVSAGQHNAAESLVEEYNLILKQYIVDTKKGRDDFTSRITETDKAKLELLYNRMSKKQQSAQMVAFIPSAVTPPIVVPTDQQLELWTDSNTYAVWVDEKKVENRILNDYSNTDFSLYRVSKPSKNVKIQHKQYYEVNLITKEFYHERYNTKKANPGKSVIVVRRLDKQ